jgi:MscS family membrane protein
MAAVFYAISLIAFSAASRVFWGYVAATVATIGLTWFGLCLIDSAGGLFEGGPQARLGTGRIAMARLLDKLLKALVVLVGVAILFHIAGVNPTAFLAGVGIGGVAVALAAQKSLENILGAMTIISDKAIRVGDVCRAGEFTGTVEDIGLRSTRIRTPGRTVVSIPNGQLITMSLENFSLRDKFLFHHRIHLSYETSADRLRDCLAGIRTVLDKHPMTEAETARASLTAFLDLSIEVEVFAHLLESSHNSFLTAQEELLLRILEIVGASGAKFAIPPAIPVPAKDRSTTP